MPNEDLINTPKVVGDSLESDNTKMNEDVAVIQESQDGNSFKKMNLSDFLSGGVVIRNYDREPSKNDRIDTERGREYGLGSLWIYNNSVWMLTEMDQSSAVWVKLENDIDPNNYSFTNAQEYESAVNRYNYDSTDSSTWRWNRYWYSMSYDMIINGVSKRVYTSEGRCPCAGHGCSGGCNSGCNTGCVSCRGCIK